VGFSCREHGCKCMNNIISVCYNTILKRQNLGGYIYEANKTLLWVNMLRAECIKGQERHLAGFGCWSDWEAGNPMTQLIVNRRFNICAPAKFLKSATLWYSWFWLLFALQGPGGRGLLLLLSWGKLNNLNGIHPVVSKISNGWSIAHVHLNIELNLKTAWWLQLLAVPKARIEKSIFWDVFKEFPVSQWVLDPFAWHLSRSLRIIQAKLVIERKSWKYPLFGNLSWWGHFGIQFHLQVPIHIPMVWIFVCGRFKASWRIS
jgi:hypothetical protein